MLKLLNLCSLKFRYLILLNSSGESIFDIYYEYISMSKEQQASMLEDTTFLSSIEPKSILLEVTAEEVEHFMRVQQQSATYQITLLPRKRFFCNH